MSVDSDLRRRKCGPYVTTPPDGRLEKKRMPTRDVTTMTMRVVLATSEFGTPRPTIKLDLPRHTSWRLAKAALYGLAAAVEMASPPTARWVVYIAENKDHHHPGGSVQIELADGTPAESREGMAVLERVFARLATAPEGTAFELLRR